MLDEENNMTEEEKAQAHVDAMEKALAEAERAFQQANDELSAAYKKEREARYKYEKASADVKQAMQRLVKVMYHNG
jgi:phage-related tail protein